MEPHSAGASEPQEEARGVHEPVMVREVLEVLAPAPGERFLDATIGAAGHSFEIASRLGPEGVLVGMDLDAQILEIAGKRLAGPGLARSYLVHGNYLDCRQALAEAGLEKVDGVLADLGASSLQFGAAERGFSFAKDGPLDMRMDAGADAATAEEIVNEAPEGELADIFWRYGENLPASTPETYAIPEPTDTATRISAARAGRRVATRVELCRARPLPRLPPGRTTGVVQRFARIHEPESVGRAARGAGGQAARQGAHRVRPRERKAHVSSAAGVAPVHRPAAHRGNRPRRDGTRRTHRGRGGALPRWHR